MRCLATRNQSDEMSTVMTNLSLLSAFFAAEIAGWFCTHSLNIPPQGFGSKHWYPNCTDEKTGPGRVSKSAGQEHNASPEQNEFANYHLFDLRIHFCWIYPVFYAGVGEGCCESKNLKRSNIKKGSQQIFTKPRKYPLRLLGFTEHILSRELCC